MQYSEGKLGRIFVIKFDNDDDLNAELAAFARKKKIATAFIIFLGGLRRATMVAGPKKAVMPPVPNFIKVKDGWEVFGTGSIFIGADKMPSIHLHIAGGKKLKTVTACVRKDSRVFGAIEAFLVEIKGAKAKKAIDQKTGLNMLFAG